MVLANVSRGKRQHNIGCIRLFCSCRLFCCFQCPGDPCRTSLQASPPYDLLRWFCSGLAQCASTAGPLYWEGIDAPFWRRRFVRRMAASRRRRKFGRRLSHASPRRTVCLSACQLAGPILPPTAPPLFSCHLMNPFNLSENPILTVSRSSPFNIYWIMAT